MEIILLERIEKLGQMGDLVSVKPGYARNFLLPQGKALRATDANKKHFEDRRAQLEAENLGRRREAEQIAQKLNGTSVVLVRAASEMGQLYGSASSRDIATQVTEAGFTINRTQVELNTAIKSLGLFPVRIILHPEVAAEITVNIARSPDEAKEQEKLGRAIITDITELERLEKQEQAAPPRQAASAVTASEKEQANADKAEGADKKQKQAASADMASEKERANANESEKADKQTGTAKKQKQAASPRQAASAVTASQKQEANSGESQEADKRQAASAVTASQKQEANADKAEGADKSAGDESADETEAKANEADEKK